ncbi:N-formylglutamate amidohydrolase, partial [Alphaproteobacteria bacterium]|nr:N-formylglutamate amidohydrolase [Alphaproteobacteria bacterium]
MSLVFHIPHASKFIPEEYLQFFDLSKNLLDEELLLMTDHYTDELFSVSKVTAERVVFPVSRLLVDPERFESDVDEPMSEVGMGCVYRLTHNGRALKNPDQIRERLIEGFYRPHHQKLKEAVDKGLKNTGKSLIIDCHSFPKKPLPYELNQSPTRAEICIGTDPFHTSLTLTDFVVSKFRAQGFSVALNEPFAGSIVPAKFWRSNKSVQSIM